MTIGNQSSKIVQMPSMYNVRMVALLPIPIKNRNIHQKQVDGQLQSSREVLNEVLRQVLQPLTFERNPRAVSWYFNTVCGDGNFRHRIVVLVEWCANFPEYSDQHHLERHVCVCCKCPKNGLGDYVAPDTQHPWRNHNLYRMVSDANTKAEEAKLSLHHVYQGLNMFRHIPCIVSNLPKPTLLHTMQIGMLDHLQKRIFHFMKPH